MKSFTLVETLIVIFIFGLAMAAVLGFILILYKTHGYQMEQSLAISEARRGIETMAKEIREAREGENGAYPIEYAGDKEFIFYSDIDNDGKTERVRYFLGQVINQNLTQECFTSSAGGSCNVSFSGFLTGTLKSAKVSVSVEGDLGSNNEYVDIYLDGQKIGTLCQTGCTDCAGTWQGTQVFDVFNQAQDGILNFTADASFRVNCGTGEPKCNWGGYHTMKAKFELEISQEIQGTELKKGVIKPTGSPPTYPQDQEKISVITSYVRNSPPIFEYFDQNGQKITFYPARLTDTKLMKVFLVVNVDPNRPPTEYQLESFVQLRNLKQE
jgi:type II secretory pathway pseudopilin PulG